MKQENGRHRLKKSSHVLYNLKKKLNFLDDPL